MCFCFDRSVSKLAIAAPPEVFQRCNCHDFFNHQYLAWKVSINSSCSGVLFALRKAVLKPVTDLSIHLGVIGNSCQLHSELHAHTSS